MKIKKETTFEQAMTRLEAIVAQLDSGEAGLDQATAMFAEARALSEYCRDKLAGAEQQISELTKSVDGSPVEIPFEG